MIRQRRLVLALFCVAALTGRFSLADAYDPPPTYYNSATGTGATLKQQLHDIIDNHTVISYDAARSALQVTDADPNQPGHMLTVYDRTSLDVSAINPGGPIPGWDSGTTWNREHTWPRSRGVGSSGPDESDLFNLRPALTANNGDRGNLNFGGVFGAQSWGTVSDGGSKWYPGDADAGMIARQEFYMAVRYDGTDANTIDLELFAGDPSTSQGLGDLNRMLEWHYAAPPDSFERGRNQIIYDQYQHNRDPFIDHPEYVWSVFVKDSQGNSIPNDSQISIVGASFNADGSSTEAVDLGRVLVGSAVPAAQTFTLNKLGNDGTYYEITTGGAATSSITGRFNAFRTNQTDSKSISVGLNTSTASSGLRTGTVTVDNLDITTGGGTGHGANDANDTFNLSLTVLDHATPSFSLASVATSLTHDFGNIALGSSAPTFNFDVFDLYGTSSYTANMDFDNVTPSGDSTAFTTDLAASAGSFQIAPGGTGHTFTSSLNLASVGTFTATYMLMFSDEDLPGAESKSVSLTLTGTVRLAGDYNGDGVVDGGDYLIWRRMLGQTGVAAYSGADGDGNMTVNQADYDVWRAHFGQTASGSGAGASLTGSTAVPEPISLWLAAAAIMVGGLIRRR